MARQGSKAGMVNRFLGHVLPGIIRPMHALWNEVIGFVFIVLAIWAAPSAWRNIRAVDGNSESFFKAAISVGFALLMAYFGISSFLKARKISRS
jgi:ABC-type glucose/galactose transport system permease subunit